MMKKRMLTITESTRAELLDFSKRSDPESDGETRLKKTFRQTLSNSTKEVNDLDMNKLFNEGIISVDVPVVGETDTYEVRIEFGNVLKNIQDNLKRSGELTQECIVKALMKAFNEEDLKVRCECEDFNYRESYWTDEADSLYPPPQPEYPDETNPDNSKGLTCKHVNIVLTVTSWLIKCAMVIFNYINYMEKNYANLYENVIYPALYQKDYTAPEEEIPEENPEPEFDIEKDYEPREYPEEEGEVSQQDFDINKKDEPEEKRFDFDSEISDY